MMDIDSWRMVSDKAVVSGSIVNSAKIEAFKIMKKHAPTTPDGRFALLELATASGSTQPLQLVSVKTAIPVDAVPNGKSTMKYGCPLSLVTKFHETALAI